MAEQESKKRKRLSNGAGTPHKKLAIQRVEVIHVHDNGLHPVLLSTPGMSAPHLPFKAFSKPKSTKSATAPCTPASHDLLLQSSQHPRLDYVAAPTLNDDHLKHYVCAYDPEKGTLEMAVAHHLSLKNTLRSETQDLEQHKLSNAKQREELGREFGTKKARKAIASKTENAITADPKDKGKSTDVQAAILETVGEITSGIASKLSEKEQADVLLAAKPIPKPNLGAEAVEEVYTFDVLVPPNDARLLKVADWRKKVAEEEKIDFPHHHTAARFEGVARSDDTRRLQALKYLSLLLEFNSALSGGGRGGKKVPKQEILAKKLPSSRWPEPLVASVRRRFTSESGQELGKWQQDNLFTHICALALYCDYWECDVYLLKEDTKLDLKQITQYFAELGCKVSQPTESERNKRKMTKAQGSATRIAKLKLPLQFPKVSAGRRT